MRGTSLTGLSIGADGADGNVTRLGAAGNVHTACGRAYNAICEQDQCV